MGYKHVIFDFNGTLVNSLDVIEDVLNGLIARSRFKELTPRDFEKVRSLPFGKKARVLLFFAKYQKEFLRQFHENIARVKFVEGVKETLVLLNEKNIEFSILSGNTQAMITDFFKLHGISVKQIYQSQRLFGKYRRLKKIIKQSRCKSADVLYICDEVRDVSACNKSGVDAIFVKWGIDAAADLTGLKLKAVAETPEQLSELLTG